MMLSLIKNKLQDIYYIIPYDYRIENIYYNVKCFLWTRYKIVNPRYLPCTWVDRRDLLPHAMFEILSDFIEKECSPGYVEWHSGMSHKTKIDGRIRFNRDIMQELYTWWHSIYNKYYTKVENDLFQLLTKHSPAWDEFFIHQEDGSGIYSIEQAFNNNPQLTLADKAIYNKVSKSLNTLETFIYEELEEKLHKMIKIRGSMWT